MYIVSSLLTTNQQVNDLKRFLWNQTNCSMCGQNLQPVGLFVTSTVYLDLSVRRRSTQHPSYIFRTNFYSHQLIIWHDIADTLT